MSVGCREILDPRHLHRPDVGHIHHLDPVGLRRDRVHVHRLFSRSGKPRQKLFLHKNLGGPRHPLPDGIQRVVHRHAEHHKPYGGGHHGKRRQHNGEHLSRSLHPHGVCRHRTGDRHRPVFGTPAGSTDYLYPLQEIVPLFQRPEGYKVPRHEILLCDEREPLHPLPMLYGHLLRIHLHRRTVRRYGIGGQCHNNETPDAVLISGRRIRIRRGGPFRPLHRSRRSQEPEKGGPAAVPVECHSRTDIHGGLCFRRGIYDSGPHR